MSVSLAVPVPVPCPPLPMFMSALLPVFVSARKAELHYSGYCKSVLSPAFHSVPFSTDFHMNTHDSEEPEHSEKFMWEVRTR